MTFATILLAAVSCRTDSVMRPDWPPERRNMVSPSPQERQKLLRTDSLRKRAPKLTDVGDCLVVERFTGAHGDDYELKRVRLAASAAASSTAQPESSAPAGRFYYIRWNKLTREVERQAQCVIPRTAQARRDAIARFALRGAGADTESEPAELSAEQTETPEGFSMYEPTSSRPGDALLHSLTRAWSRTWETARYPAPPPFRPIADSDAGISGECHWYYGDPVIDCGGTTCYLDGGGDYECDNGCELSEMGNMQSPSADAGPVTAPAAEGSPSADESDGSTSVPPTTTGPAPGDDDTVWYEFDCCGAWDMPEWWDPEFCGEGGGGGGGGGGSGPPAQATLSCTTVSRGEHTECEVVLADELGPIRQTTWTFVGTAMGDPFEREETNSGLDWDGRVVVGGTVYALVEDIYGETAEASGTLTVNERSWSWTSANRLTYSAGTGATCATGPATGTSVIWGWVSGQSGAQACDMNQLLSPDPQTGGFTVVSGTHMNAGVFFVSSISTAMAMHSNILGVIRPNSTTLYAVGGPQALRDGCIGHGVTGSPLSANIHTANTTCTSNANWVNRIAALWAHEAAHATSAHAAAGQWGDLYDRVEPIVGTTSEGVSATVRGLMFDVNLAAMMASSQLDHSVGQATNFWLPRSGTTVWDWAPAQVFGSINMPGTHAYSVAIGTDFVSILRNMMTQPER